MCHSPVSTEADGAEHQFKITFVQSADMTTLRTHTLEHCSHCPTSGAITAQINSTSISSKHV